MLQRHRDFKEKVTTAERGFRSLTPSVTACRYQRKLTLHTHQFQRTGKIDGALLRRSATKVPPNVTRYIRFSR
jgi:hypothetical protein